MNDRVEQWVLGGLLAAIAACLVGAYMSHLDDQERHRVFMAECQADGKKRYECEAMDRAGDSHTAVVPMPVVVGR